MFRTDVYETAFEIRAFESKLLDLFKEGKLFGTVHTYIGQELCAAALYPHLNREIDAVFATHRGHGHYLAYGGPAEALLAEIMGREGALCLGRGGTQNLCYKRFYTTGIQGATALLATGFAWAMKYRGEKGIAIAQIGDGTLGEGALYEAFTFASLLQVPVLFLLECNGYAQSTDVMTTTPGDIVRRISGFGLEVDRKTADDPELLFSHLAQVVEKVRSRTPFVQIIETRRLQAHSKGDDNRPQELIDELWRQDPLCRLLEQSPDAQKMFEKAQKEVDEVARRVLAKPLLQYDEQPALPAGTSNVSSSQIQSDIHYAQTYGRVVEELNRALHKIMADNKDVLLIGEDLLDPYGGAFKVSRDLSSKYPEQVFSTPISEAAIVGVSNGLALAGMRPVAEIMFADFVTLAADQLINHAAKFYYMYGAKVSCPLTVRMPSGGGRGYGPTHSQSLENLFCGVPGLRVIALSQRHHPGRLLAEVVLNSNSPTLFVENKLLYALQPANKPPIDLQVVMTERSNGDFPPLYYTPLGGKEPDLTIVTYGGMTRVVETAMHQLICEKEFRFDYVIVTQLWPLTADEIVESVRRTRRLVVVEENVPDYGFCAAVIAAVAQKIPTGFVSRAVGMRPVPIPSARQLEEKVIPSAKTIIQAINEVTAMAALHEVASEQG